MTQRTPFVSIREAAALSGLSVYWWRQAVANNRVPYLKSGAKIFIDYEKALTAIRDSEVA